MKIKTDKKLKEVKYFVPTTFKDFRGEIWTNWNENYFKNIKFNLDKFFKLDKSLKTLLFNLFFLIKLSNVFSSLSNVQLIFKK